jgi:hypothetical protein
MRRLTWWVALGLAVVVTLPPYAGAATGTYINYRWTYDWAYRGRYVLYRTWCTEGEAYQIEVVPETRADDPDLFVGTRRPRGTDDPGCSPWNYLWKSTRHGGYTERLSWTAGYTGYHYFCVYAYAPKWTGWYLRVRHL